MKVLITGATGFVGKKLVSELASRSHKVSVLTRDLENARRRLPIDCEIHRWEPELYPPSSQAFSDVNAVIHLAGSNIASGRWTASRKKSIHNSRILSTQNLVSTLKSLRNPPQIFLSASAIGFYGNNKLVELYEDLQPGKGFLADVCKKWEHEALIAQDHDIRTIVLRIGIVLGYDGGALKKMLPPFCVGLGGNLGDGNQWMSWIHIKDLVNMIIHSIENKSTKGPYNAVSPESTTNKVFTKCLAQVLKRPAILPIPKFALKIILGEMAGLLLGSQKVSSNKILESGFKFQYPDLVSSLTDLCKNSTNELIVEHWLPLPIPIDKIFVFFKEPKNLEKITPYCLHFKVLNQSSKEIKEGTKINYWLRLHGIPIWWQSKITDWQPNSKFSDTQTHGPYKYWHHKHEFHEKDGGTLIRDHIQYKLPFGILGDCLMDHWVRKDLENIFDFRKKKIQEIFNTANTPPTN